ncbi:MAG: carboxymuconolactone decarboxylase family protein [Bryobacteraceae bacterium]
MKPRMTQPAMVYPETMQALLALAASTKSSGLPEKLFELIHLRASQINGCAFCSDMHSKALKRHGETDERLYTVATWHDAPFFTDAERAVLALTEAGTRLADRSDAVPDEVWDEAKRHCDEKQLAAIVIHIAAINAWNRLNVITRQVAGKMG